MRASRILLTVWAGLNAVVAAYVTVATLAGAAPPALRLVLSSEQVSRVDPAALGVIHAQAAIANPLILVVCAWVIVAAWTALHERWVRVTLIATLLPLQAFGFVSDGYLGGTNLIANVISTAILGAGLALTAAAKRGAPGV